MVTLVSLRSLGNPVWLRGRALGLALQLVVDHLGDLVERLGAGEEAAVDEHGRGAADARLGALVEVGLDLGGGLVPSTQVLNCSAFMPSSPPWP